MSNSVNLTKSNFEKVLKQDLSLAETAETLGVSKDAVQKFCHENYAKTFLAVQQDLLRFPRELRALCQIQCTRREIQLVLGIPEYRTLDRKCREEWGKSFAEVSAEFKEGGKASLRRIQFALAEKSAAMAIFLGKNYLGQSDQPESSITIFDRQNSQKEEKRDENGDFPLLDRA